MVERESDFDSWASEKRSNYFEEKWYGNLDLFKSHKNIIKKFPVILIDEIQDYQENWVRIIRECFLDINGEYVVFGDEKQNVYERSMDLDKKPYTGIGGAWNQLKESFRLSTQIAALANSFQDFFFNEKYEINKIQVALFERKEHIEYIPVNDTSNESIWRLINERAEKHQIHPNDICILSDKINILRGIDLCARLISNFKTTINFESQENYWSILMQLNKDDTRLKEKLSLFNEKIDAAINAIRFNYLSESVATINKLHEYLRNQRISIDEYKERYKDILPFLDSLIQDHIENRFINELEKFRKYKKNHFWMNSGTIKLSTIHSFKGWEIDTLFLIIQKGSISNSKLTDELIYTALTRCHHNLFILDCDQSRYASFFKAALF